MHPPPGLTEKQVLDAIEHVTVHLRRKYALCRSDWDDTAQEARLLALNALHKYKPEVGSLENFLYVHVRNRLMNRRRAVLGRWLDVPCKQCHEGQPCGADGEVCQVYQRWLKRNQTKTDLFRPGCVANVSEDEPRIKVESTAAEEVEVRDLEATINEKLPVELRMHYLQLRDGLKLSKSKKEEVREAVREILEEAGYF